MPLIEKFHRTSRLSKPSFIITYIIACTMINPPCLYSQNQRHNSTLQSNWGRVIFSFTIVKEYIYMFSLLYIPAARLENSLLLLLLHSKILLHHLLFRPLHVDRGKLYVKRTQTSHGLHEFSCHVTKSDLWQEREHLTTFH